MLLSFGVSSFVTLLVVVILACVSAYRAGNAVNLQSDVVMRRQVTENLLAASRLVSEQMDSYMVDLEGTVQLIVEAVKDRISGYPYPGWEEDRYVPFFDMDTQTRVYPLEQPPPPLEWDIVPNVNGDNAWEHVQEREPWLGEYGPAVSTASAAYFMQGACDPTQDDPRARTYFPNCTEANNNVTTGGVVQPTQTNRGLYQKSGDLSIFLKALFESQHNALAVGIYFHNSGAGSQVVFPGFHWRGPGHEPYESVGCDWMKEINPNTGRPIASTEEIARCRPNGTVVPQRQFNAMEQPWCKQFALNPDNVGWYGPYRSFDSGVSIMTIGRSIFDRRYVDNFPGECYFLTDCVPL